ncbi:hypothetical protein PG984_015168 [Apiospora sp. TS-2023a]
MKRLGPELISLIIDQLKTGDNENHSYTYLSKGYAFEASDSNRLSQYATISPAWQHEVERRCFRSLELCSTEDVAILSRLISRCPGRRACLSHIIMSSLPRSLPPGRYSQHPLTFRADVAALLAVLHRFDEEDEQAGISTDATLCLELKPSWDMRVRASLDMGSSFDNGIRRLDELDFALHHLPTFPKWTLLETPSPEPLPSSRRVRELKVENPGAHPIAVALACQSLADEEVVDLVCEAVRKLAQPTVESLLLGNWLISEDLFLNRRRDASPAANNTWLQLCDLSLFNSLMAPNGKWYVTGQPSDEPSDPTPLPDEAIAAMAGMDSKAGMGTERGGIGTARENGADFRHRWRRHIDNSTLTPLLETITEAVTKHMPQLREFEFLVGGHCQEDHSEGAEGRPALVVLYHERCSGDRRRWEVERGGTFQGWDIPPRLREAWKRSSDG